MASRLIDRFVQWAEGRDGIEPDVVETLVDFKRDYLGDAQEGRWRAGDLTEVLLDLIPAKVTADDQWYAAVIPTMRAFLGFARSEGLLHRGSAPVSALLQELDDVEDQFSTAVTDPARFGLAKAVMSAVGDIDLSDPEAVQVAMDRFNALPIEERRAATDPAIERMVDEQSTVVPFGGFNAHVPGSLDDELDGTGDGFPQLPVVRLAPVPQLAAAARECPVWQRLQILTTWLGERRPVTTAEVLKLADARAVCAKLGVRPVPDWANQPWRDDLGPGAAVSDADLPPLPEPPVRGSKDIDALHRLWTLARFGGWIEIEDRSAVRGPAWDASRAGDDDEDLRLWTELFAAALEMSMGAGDSRRYPITDDRPAAAVVHALMSSYVGEEHTLGELLDEMLHAEEDVLGESSLDPETERMLRRIEGRRMRQRLDRLVDLGAVALHDDDTITLTPLGTWGMHVQLETIGLNAPALGDVVGLDAEELLLRTEALPVDDAEAARAEWIEARGRREAADALLHAAREGSAMIRIAAMSVLDDELTEVTAEACRPWLDDPLLGRHVRVLFARLGELDDAGLTAEDRCWLAVESLAALLEDVERPVDTDDLMDEGWSVAEGALELASVWTLDHPQLLTVLDAIGTGHPRVSVRKTAKKAAHKARMAPHGG
ncbi:MAG: hypothetical protein GXX79_13160 [Actinomycetales bacterium]|nr:hypothetical protein [Actinomycetales bacterium]